MEPTKRQLEYIKFIEENTGIKYRGRTKQDASKYISENKDRVLTNTWALVNGY